MSFLIKNEKLIENYNEICDKAGNSMKKGFDSEPVCKKNIWKLK